jgi:Lamin Tail Domain
LSGFTDWNYNSATMWRNKRKLQVMTAITASLMAAGQLWPVSARAASAPSLVISQLKITSSNGQFVTLYNPTGLTLDMSKYQLEYFNNYDLSKATSSRLISLSGTVPPHGYFMVNDGVYTLCYQLSVDSVSLGLSSTAGLVEVVAFDQSSPGGSVSPVLQDYVGWSKIAAAGAQTLPANTSAFLQRQPVDAANNPAVSTAGLGSWLAVQPASGNACNLINSSNLNNVATGFGQLLPAVEPAATIISADDDSAPSNPTASLPAADIGLMTPTVTELLPNPAGSGNDATDEFIELYNPNSSGFDLSGFSLQAGMTSLHTYSFVSGTMLPAGSFTAFYSTITGLSLSNTSGQVKLLDPSGNAISATAAYGTAKDGLAWALANGKWYWTTKLTPGAANIINQPPATKKTTASTSSSKSKTKPTAKTTKIPKTKATASYSSAAATTPSSTPIHIGTLALVAGLGLLYGAYEYRADLANRFHRLSWHSRARPTDRPTVQGGRGRGIDQ